jgi:hypothetical protein
VSGAPPSPTSGSPQSRTSGPADDPLAADKRTLIIAVIAMIVLVSVGVVSAAVFTGSACQDASPSFTSPTAASPDASAGLEAAFPAAEAAQRAAFDAQLSDLADRLGPITGVAVTDGADRLAVTTDGVAAVGPVTSLLDARGAEVLARVEVGAGVVVGDGDALVSLARVNDLTGQVDAFATLDATAAGALSEIGCIDTATVGTPLAFELDADDGQLLLFRAEEDGDDAELELRDPRDGRQWFSRVDVGVAPPGVTGERIEARLGDRLAVLVRRTDPGEDVPLVTAVDRADGAPVWELGRDGLVDVEVGAPPITSGASSAGSGAGGPVLREDAAQRLALLALDDDQVVFAVTDARDQDAVTAGGTAALGPPVGPGAVVALDARDGAVRWTAPLDDEVAVLAGVRDDAGTWLVVEDDGRMQLVALDGTGRSLGAASGDAVAEVEAPGPVVDPASSTAANGPPVDPSAAVIVAPSGAGDGRQVAIAVLGDALVVITATEDQLDAHVDGPHGGEADGRLRARDVVVAGGRTHVLFAGPDGGGATGTGEQRVVVTFGDG